MVSRKHSGFTLIELLIVVAIIAILAAIAIPNFLAAQVRSKVARVKGNARTVATALEAYTIDYNDLPWEFGGAAANGGSTWFVPIYITSPIAYITSVPDDIFNVRSDLFGISQSGGHTRMSWNMYLRPQNYTFYVNTGQNNGNAPDIQVNSYSNNPTNVQYVVFSVGPGAPTAFGMQQQGQLAGTDYGYWYNAGDGESYPIPQPYRYWYDPTNGTVSLGYVVRQNGGTNSP